MILTGTSTSRPPVPRRLRSRLRSVAGVRLSGSCLARVVRISRNLVWGPLSLVRARIRSRLVRWIRMGLGPLGIRLAQPLPCFRSPEVLFSIAARSTTATLSTVAGVRGGGVFNRPGIGARPYEGSRPEARGWSGSRGESGMSSGAFSHYDHGGESRGYSSRGESSFHGGGFSGGRGGFGGGGHGGGGRR